MQRTLVCLLLCAVPLGGPAAVAPSADERIAEMEAGCTAAAEAIQARQAESSLIVRLGGRSGIEAMFAEAMRLHAANERIAHLFAGIDTDSVVRHATDFLIAGAGGDAVYTGRDVVALHAPMQITSEDFLAAGADFEAAMAKLGLGAAETQEMMCALVSLRGMVMATERDD